MDELICRKEVNNQHVCQSSLANNTGNKSDFQKEQATTTSASTIAEERFKALPPDEVLKLIAQQNTNSFTSSSIENIAEWYYEKNPQNAPQNIGEKTKAFTKLYSQLNTAEAHKLLNLAIKEQVGELAADIVKVKDILGSAKYSYIINELAKDLVVSNIPATTLIGFNKLSDQTLTAHFSIIKTEGFKRIYNLFTEQLKIPVEKDLTVILGLFYEPQSISKFDSQQYLHALKETRQRYPEATTGSWELLTLTDKIIGISNYPPKSPNSMSSEDIDQRFANFDQRLKTLNQIYHVSGSTRDDLWKLADLSDKDWLKLTSNEGRKTYDFLKTIDPRMLPGSSIKEFLNYGDGLIGKWINPLSSLGININDYQRFLNEILKVPFDQPSKYISYFGSHSSERLKSLNSTFKDEVITENFSNFINQLKNDYPGIKNSFDSGNYSYLPYVVDAFLDKDRFLALNTLVQQFNRDKQDLPELNMRNASEFHTFLSALQKSNFSQIYLRSFNDSSMSGAKLSNDFNSAEFLANPKILEEENSEKVYTALLNNWKVDKIPALDFLRIILNPEISKAILDPEAPKKLLTLKQAYHLENAFDPCGNFYVLPQILTNYDLLSKNSDIIRKYGRIDSYYKLADASKDKIFNDRESVVAVTTLLEDHFKFSEEEIERFLKQEPINKELLTNLSAKNTHEMFDLIIKNWHLKSPSLALSVAREISATDCKNLTQAFDQLGIRITNYQDVESLKELLALSIVKNDLNNPKFIEFSKDIYKRFYRSVADINSLEDLSDLYNKIESRPELKRALKSKEFDQTLNFLQSKFGVYDRNPQMLLPVIETASNLDLANVTKLYNELVSSGESLIAADLSLLCHLAIEPNLMKLYKNPDLQKSIIDSIYRSPAYFRSNLDKVSFLTSLQADKQQIEQVKLNYTERPPLSEFSNLERFKLAKLCQSLQSSNILNKLGTIISTDIKDKTTEHGGRLVIREGEISFEEDRSLSKFDESFSPRSPAYYWTGMGQFHLHALTTDNSEFSGPSGFLGSGGDIGNAVLTGAFNVVFTTMGHPRDSQGNPDRGKLLINVDAYLVDKKHPENIKVKIVDLSTIVVPYGE